jgi:hypothetical protein
MESHNNRHAEAWIGSEWIIIPVETALEYPDLIRRCLECGGAIRLHRASQTTSHRAHAEHRRRFKGCSLGDCFDGTNRRNPDEVPSPSTSTFPVSIIPEEELQASKYLEGATVTVRLNRYERSAKARKACISHYGHSCSVCDRMMENIYGRRAFGLIHVHHLRPLSSLAEEYEVDPIEDLRPVCPNCHAVIHFQTPMLTIDQARRLVENAKAEQVGAGDAEEAV